MPAASLVPKNGAIVYGTLVADYHSWVLERAQQVGDATPYGTNVCSKNVGNGTPDFNFTINAFALAHAANTAPLLGTAQTNQSTTFTLDTGVTEAGSLVESRFQITHGRMQGTVPYLINAKNAGDITETWALS